MPKARKRVLTRYQRRQERRETQRVRRVERAQFPGLLGWLRRLFRRPTSTEGR